MAARRCWCRSAATVLSSLTGLCIFFGFFPQMPLRLSEAAVEAGEPLETAAIEGEG